VIFILPSLYNNKQKANNKRYQQLEIKNALKRAFLISRLYTVNQMRRFLALSPSASDLAFGPGMAGFPLTISTLFYRIERREEKLKITFLSFASTLYSFHASRASRASYKFIKL